MATPLDPREIVTVQELAVSKMLELETLRQLLFEKGIVTKDEVWPSARSLTGRRRNEEANLERRVLV